MNILTTLKHRVEVVDVLRGFAIMAIMILHNIEHFNFYNFPPAANEFMKSLDRSIWDSLFFLFAGKAYAIFSLLFGFTFYIQYKNQQDKGYDFRLRFLWRMVILLLLGCFNGAFFPGDILVLYAIIGPVLVLSCRWSNKAVLIFAIFLLLQPMEWAKFIHAWQNPDITAEVAQWKIHARNYYPYLSKPSFFDTIKSNLWDGQLFSLLWGYDHGRFFQTGALFLFGMLLGRTGKFQNLEQNYGFWRKVLIGGGICFVPFYFLTESLPDFVSAKAMLTPLNTIVSSFKNMSFMLVLVAFIVLLWQTVRGVKLFSIFIPYGKMSLTNYITQSIVGSFIYFEYGLGMWNDFGVTASFATGVLFFIVQLMFCKWWLNHFKQGPFEYVFSKATWIGK